MQQEGKPVGDGEDTKLFSAAVSLSSSAMVSRILETFCRTIEMNCGGATSVAILEAWVFAINFSKKSNCIEKQTTMGRIDAKKQPAQGLNGVGAEFIGKQGKTMEVELSCSCVRSFVCGPRSGPASLEGMAFLAWSFDGNSGGHVGAGIYAGARDYKLQVDYVTWLGFARLYKGPNHTAQPLNLRPITSPFSPCSPTRSLGNSGLGTEVVFLPSHLSHPPAPRPKSQAKIGTLPLNAPHIFIDEILTSLIQKCRSLTQLQQVQAQIITHGFQQNQHLAPRIVTSFFELKKPEHARRWFNCSLNPNTILWNVMFKGYSWLGSYQETLALFDQMRIRCVRPNRYTFTFVLKSCAKIPELKKGEEVHCFVIKTGFECNGFVGTTLVDLYSAGAAIEEADKVFGLMPVRNVVAWTAIVSAYISAGDLESARRRFDEAVERDVVVWNIMICGYIGSGDMHAARELFECMPDRDLMAWNTILHGYANCGDLNTCVKFFDEMPEKNVFSWNGLIGGFAHHGRFSEVLCSFSRMLRESNVLPNDATLVNALSACAKLGALDFGRWVHQYAETNGLKGNVYVGNGLVDMYAKCGSIETAIEVFQAMQMRDLITWNAMIGGLSMHGRGFEALSIFHQLKNAGERPDGITFVGVLCACTHTGLVQRGFSYFREMVEEYSITPWIEHYGCMVDLLGRAGFLNEALHLVRKMPMEADSVIWSTLLGACRTYGDVDLAEISGKWLMKLQPSDAVNYVVLSNIYGATGSWKDVARLKLMMRERSSGKLPGCSLIEVNYHVSEFCSSDVRHSETREIYSLLEGLTELLKLDRSTISRRDIVED